MIYILLILAIISATILGLKLSQRVSKQQGKETTKWYKKQ